MPSIINATTTNGVAISPDNSGSLQLATNNGTTAVTIDTSQNVGVGTTSPNGVGKLVIKGGSGSTTGLAVVASANDSYLTIYNTGSVHYIQATYSATGSYQPIAFLTNDIERMRITSGGVVCVGTTSQVGSGKTVVAYDSGSFVGIAINQTNAGAAGYLMSFRLNGTEVGSIYQNTSTTAYNTSSDYRLKENIAPMTGALNKVLQLKPCTYTWKSTGETGEGFIAHELQAVVPDAVTGEKDAVETVDDVDADGKVIGTKEVPKYQGVDTSFLVATLTAAIQELKAELDATKAEVQALKGVA